MMNNVIFPAEWHKQSGVQLTWPHIDTDWYDMLEEVENCFLQIAKEVAERETLLVVAPNIEAVRQKLSDFSVKMENVLLVEMHTNDTWARDHGGITVFVDGAPVVCDFQFNGWGLKFASNLDNMITSNLFEFGVFNAKYKNLLSFAFEGGSIESDGKGTLMTTSECLLSPNRNGGMFKEEIENFLKVHLGAQRVLWINNGYLAGDDTDSHVDTLARFCDECTIAYVKCDDRNDEHFEALQRMECDIKSFRMRNGEPYRLIELPMAECVLDEIDDRLPATYANFLIMNEVVLMPSYGSAKDEVAKNQLQKAFPGREIISIDCRPLIRQHGSLHCVTMQYPEGVINNELI
ncbi:MAG: agmatine deiminase family protein [Bacteroidales bacterium]|nr:agmatine deiminase family protein [Bacteroidales bacterium]